MGETSQHQGGRHRPGAQQPGSRRPVVIFTARYLPNMGGVEFFTANLARTLATKGCDVLIVTCEPAGDPAADARTQVGEGSVEVVRLGSWGISRAPFVRRDARLRELEQRLANLGGFSALINTRLYDLSAVAARLCNQLGVTPALIDHGTGYVRFPSRLLTWASMATEDFHTARLKRRKVDYYGVSRDASRWLAHFDIHSCGEIHNALDADAFVAGQSGRDFRSEFAVPADALLVTFAGRLLPEKGVDTLIETARLLAGEPRIRFCIAGSGPLEGELVAAAAELGTIHPTGPLSHPDLAALLAQGDVFCFPSRYSEGLPTSLLEAGACENVLVSSHVGGVDEIIPGEAQGIVLDDPTPRQLAEVLRGLLADPTCVGALKLAAKAHICESFTWDSTAQEVFGAFERAA